MGSLKDLNNEEKRVFLLLTSSNLAEIYVYDTLKNRCNATLESIMDINSTSTYKGMMELVNVQPNLADSWLFVIQYNKVKSLIKKALGIFQSTSSVFLIKVNNYKEFKEVKETIKGVSDLYLSSIKRNEVLDLLRGFKISQNVMDFIAYSYYREPDKVFEIRKELLNGAVIENTKDVVKLCGESQGSIQNFVLQLLTDKPKTEMYLKRSYKKRVNTLYDICESFSPMTAYNYIKASVKDILYIKMLYLEGKIYDNIRELPECFDEKKLSKYNYKLREIAEDISYDKILHLFNKLNDCGRWYNVQDGIMFLYNYYLELINEWNSNKVGVN